MIDCLDFVLQWDVATLLAEQALNTLKAHALVNLLLHVLDAGPHVADHVVLQIVNAVNAALLAHLNLRL